MLGPLKAIGSCSRKYWATDFVLLHYCFSLVVYTVLLAHAPFPGVLFLQSPTRHSRADNDTLVVSKKIALTTRQLLNEILGPFKHFFSSFPTKISAHSNSSTAAL